MTTKALVSRQYSRIALLGAVLIVAAGCADPSGPGEGGFPLLTEPPGSEITGELRLAYEEDAVRLAIRELITTGSPARHDVRPPAALVASLYTALAHVHAWTHPARDTVIDVYSIHSFPHPQTRQIMVRVDPTHEWTSSWRSLTPLTGNAAVDSLVAAYELSVTRYFEWTIGDVALLRAPSPLNAVALAARFEPIAGVVWAETDGVVGDGNDIRARRHGDGWRLDYSVGYGDCPAGCIQRRTWSFSVSGAGVVRYLGASGNPPPPPQH